MEVALLNHPIVASLLTRLRDKNTSTVEFRNIVRQLTIFLGIEATQDIATREHVIETPMAEFRGSELSQTLAIVPVLRAGLGMAVGGLFGSIIYDTLGSYDVAWLFSIAASLGGVVCILLLEPTSRVLIPDWEESLPHEARAAASTR